MARTATDPPTMPSDTAKSGSKIVGYRAGMPDSWKQLLACVNSLLAHKAPVLVCDSHASQERWMGYQYPSGTSYKHRYKFPTPYVALNNITYRARIKAYGVRLSLFSGGTTSWEISVDVNGGGATSYQVNGGANPGPFVWTVADVALDHTAQYTTVDVWLKTFGGSMSTNNYILCFEVEWYAEFSALPLGLYNTSDWGVPLFALDVDLLGAADVGAHTVAFQTAAALLKYMYERIQQTLICTSKSYNTTSPWIQVLMEVSGATYETWAMCRATIPPGSPGVTIMVYSDDYKYGGDSDFRVTAGGIVTEDLTSKTNSTWVSMDVDCNAGDMIIFEASAIKVGTILIFARRGVLT